MVKVLFFFFFLTVARSVRGDSWSPVEVKDTAGMSMMRGDREKEKKEGRKDGSLAEDQRDHGLLHRLASTREVKEWRLGTKARCGK